MGPFDTGNMMNAVKICILTPVPWLYYLVLGVMSEQNQAIVSNVMCRINDSGVITSQEFPNRCCGHTSETYLLRTEPGSYIHLVFDDLDLPLGAIFKIFADSEEQEIFDDQPEYTSGVWTRPFITSRPPSNAIRVVLRAPQEIFRYNQSQFAGFKATYHVTTDPDSSYTSDLCRPVRSVLEGGMIGVKPKPISRLEGLWLDCLWVLKPPLQRKVTAPVESDLLVYLRLNLLQKITKGRLEVREGSNSESPLVTSGSDFESSAQPPEGYTSKDGFHIRAVIPADNKTNRFSFVFGYVHKIKDARLSSQCEENGGFLCSSPHQDWCLPEVHECNYVWNCPDGSDELNCPEFMAQSRTNISVKTDSLMTTTTVSPVLSSTTRDPCTYYRLCPDGRCVLFLSDCDTNVAKNGCDMLERYCEIGDNCISRFDVCPGECEEWEKKCDDGSCMHDWYMCPGEPCPDDEPYKCANERYCYTEEEKCDEDTNCWDNSDEEDCFWVYGWREYYKPVYFTLLIPIVVIVACILCCVCSKKKSRAQQAANASRATTGVPLMGGVNSNTASTMFNVENAGTDRPDLSRQDSALAPPPCYEEVTSSEIYPRPHKASMEEEPLPAYDSVIKNTAA